MLRRGALCLALFCFGTLCIVPTGGSAEQLATGLRDASSGGGGKGAKLVHVGRENDSPAEFCPAQQARVHNKVHLGVLDHHIPPWASAYQFASELNTHWLTTQVVALRLFSAHAFRTEWLRFRLAMASGLHKQTLAGRGSLGLAPSPPPAAGVPTCGEANEIVLRVSHYDPVKRLWVNLESVNYGCDVDDQVHEWHLPPIMKPKQEAAESSSGRRKRNRSSKIAAKAAKTKNGGEEERDDHGDGDSGYDDRDDDSRDSHPDDAQLEAEVALEDEVGGYRFIAFSACNAGCGGGAGGAPTVDCPAPGAYC